MRCVPDAISGFSPLDRQLGLLPGTPFLPLAQESLVRLGTWMPFAKAAELCSEMMRMTITKGTAHRLTLAAGRDLVEAEDAAVDHLFATSPEPTGGSVEHQQISIDGAFVPLIGDWAEVKTVAIGTVLQGKDGPKATDLSYFSRMAAHQRFSRQATLETHRRATDKAVRVTAVVDGADWIQEMLDLHCPRATRVLDWAHSSSYVSRAAEALFSAAGEAADWRSEQLNHEI